MTTAKTLNLIENVFLIVFLVISLVFIISYLSFNQYLCRQNEHRILIIRIILLCINTTFIFSNKKGRLCVQSLPCLSFSYLNISIPTLFRESYLAYLCPILYSDRQFWHRFSTHYFIYPNFCCRKSCKIVCGMVSCGFYLRPRLTANSSR